MKYFTNHEDYELSGELLNKDKIQNIFKITDEEFLEQFHNCELIRLEIDDQILFPTFQFHKDLININFTKIVNELFEYMDSETIIHFLFTDCSDIEIITGFNKPIDAIKNDYKKEVLVVASCYDIIQFLDSFEDPDQALIDLLNHR